MIYRASATLHVNISIITPFGSPTVFDDPTVLGPADDQNGVTNAFISVITFFAIVFAFCVFKLFAICIDNTSNRAIIIDK